MRVEIDGVEYFPKAKVEMMPSTFGEFLRRVRKSVSFSLDAASDAIGCSKSYLWELEHDRSEPSLQMAYCICNTYGVELITLASYLNSTKERHYEEVKRNTLGDPDKKTGIYAEAPNGRA